MGKSELIGEDVMNSDAGRSWRQPEHQLFRLYGSLKGKTLELFGRPANQRYRLAG